MVVQLYKDVLILAEYPSIFQRSRPLELKQ